MVMQIDLQARRPIKMWTDGVPVDAKAVEQLRAVANMPFIHKHVAVMPDVHVGKGATVGSVIATKGAVIPAAVGVDIGCGMMAVRTSLTASQLPDSLAGIRADLEAAIPHGRTHDGRPGDRGAWGTVPDGPAAVWKTLESRYNAILAKHPKARSCNNANHLGTLGTGNHFVELCLDEEQHVWVMLHSGSRGLGNKFGMYFIERAKEEMRRWHISLPDSDLAYLPQGTSLFKDYWEAISMAQDYALANRALMMEAAMEAVRKSLPHLQATGLAVNCHHNYASWENHYGDNVLVTRKGAVRARATDLGIIPGSMGAKSFIVRGKGNPESFCSCSHGAGRVMARTQAMKQISLDDHRAATQGVECRKDAGVLDESPAAYKDIEAVMAAQADLVEIVHTLKQVVCVKG
jgi:tRNA-splicing ligase RtcB (3'-phosphate/5'-hydroxy nucleic acid ligase)